MKQVVYLALILAIILPLFACNSERKYYRNRSGTKPYPQRSK